MNRLARSPLGRPVEIPFQPASFRPRSIESLALSNRPELQLARQKIEVERQRVEVAKREWIPEPQLRVEARHFKSGSQAFREYDTGVFFSIPWGNARKYSAQEREARSGVAMATQELEMARTETLGLVRDAVKKVETFHHHVELFRDRLLPNAQLTVEATRAGYESDKTTFLELITAQRGLREIESTYHRHLADYHIALAELEAIVGTDIHVFFPATETSKRTSK